MTTLYSMPVRLHATAYIRAASPEEAKQRLRAWLEAEWFELEGEGISEWQFDDPELPDLSLSPAMTPEFLDWEEPEETT